MKSLARSYFWWPKLDSEIEREAERCTDCRELQASPAPFPLQPWPWPDTPWSRVHIDYAGPIEGKMLFLLVDAHSKWIDVHVMSSSSSLATIQKLRQSFATHGIPEIIVSDNGPNLVSNEMEAFLAENGVKHVRTAPYHPATNGQAERAVQTLKRSLARQRDGSLETRVARFLLAYHITPHATTGVAPSELLMGRRLRSRLDLVRPNLSARVQQQQALQKQAHDNRARHRELAVGDSIFTRDFSKGGRWKPGQVLSRDGSTSFRCIFEDDGRLVRRHMNQVRAAAPSLPAESASSLQANAESGEVTSEEDRENRDEGTAREVTSSSFSSGGPEAENVATEAPEVPVPVRRSGRMRKSVERLSYF